MTVDDIMDKLELDAEQEEEFMDDKDDIQRPGKGNSQLLAVTQLHFSHSKNLGVQLTSSV